MNRRTFLLLALSAATASKIQTNPAFAARQRQIYIATTRSLVDVSNFQTLGNELSHNGSLHFAIASASKKNGRLSYRNAVVLAENEFWLDFDSQNFEKCLVVTHGFNTNLKEAIENLDRLVDAIDYSGAVVLFTWPSKSALANFRKPFRDLLGPSSGHYNQYRLDVNSARASVPGLQEFLVKLLSNKREKLRVDLLAHSLGSMLLTSAVYEACTIKKDIRFGDLILAAPDLSRSVFNVQLDRFKRCIRRTTIYGSHNDWALKLSQKIDDDQPRLGDPVSAEGKIGIAGVDYIDASNQTLEWLSLNHSYIWFDSMIKSDIAELLAADGIRKTPSERNSRLIEEEDDYNNIFWLTPK